MSAAPSAWARSCSNTVNSSPPNRADEIIRPHHPGERVGDAPQHVVARVVAELVVDLLEVVDVDEEDRDDVVGARVAQHLVDAFEEVTPVRDVGELVVTARRAGAAGARRGARRYRAC